MTREDIIQLNMKVDSLMKKIEITIGNIENGTNYRPVLQKNLRKVKRWLADMHSIIQRIEEIKNEKIEVINSNFNYTFQSKNLVILPFIQPILKSLFNEIKVDNKYVISDDVTIDVINNLYGLDEITQELAIIGDSAIDLAISNIHWDPVKTTSQKLNELREELGSNIHLAKICDYLKYFDLRLYSAEDDIKSKEDEIIKGKATLIEALFGIIYLERGMDQVISSFKRLNEIE